MNNRPSSLHDDVMQKLRQTASDMDATRAPTMSARTLAFKVFEHYSANPIEEHIQWTSLQHLTKMAAAVIRRYEPEEEAARRADEQGDMFSDLLQDRYPRSRRRSEEPVYVLREFMSTEDVLFNVHRMEAVGGRLLRHARALQAWHESRGNREAS